MIPTPVADIIRITGAMVYGLPTDLLVSADIEVDSRLVVPGGLFVALPGQRSDRHDHAAAA
ncbi:MAG: UDP-N-acetylmuramoyl-tripeptide--D-alanyl-D-alanine ligase, partial [Actinomycetota bacterium]|nr:UDP-N-acetylmuramoyl-tripeptide--D-alanyl-D-alanine ligase [Actinomycetota bacterium]